jgi:hypothetical protein
MRMRANNPPEGFCTRSLSHSEGGSLEDFWAEVEEIFKSSDPFPRKRVLKDTGVKGACP